MRIVKWAAEKKADIFANPEQMTDTIIAGTYETLPLPLRILVNKDSYIKFVKDNSSEIINLIAKNKS